MNLHQMSVTYVDEQDRLLVRFNTTDGDELRLWLTRRMAERILEPLTDAVGQLEARKVTLPEDNPQARRALAELRRAEAVQHSDFSTPYQPSDDKLPLGSLPLLVTQLRMTVSKDTQLHVGFEERLTDQHQTPRGFQVAMETPMAHGLIHLLEQAVAKAQWGIGGTATVAVSSNAEESTEEARPKYLQ